MLSLYLTDSMDGFHVVKLSEVVRTVDIVITCTGIFQPLLISGILITYDYWRRQSEYAQFSFW